MGYPSHQSEPTPRRTSSAFIINTEIGAVLSVMRRNVRWGIQYMEEEDQIEHTLIKSFKETRKELFSWQTQWHTINPLLYLHPFLSVIQSDETSAPITGVALSSIYKFITLEVLHLNTVNVADSLHKIIDAVTSCRFGVTDPASEEVVLVKILQVLLACMKHKASVKLSNQHVCNMVNTCFQIVHQANSKGELLQRIARQTMHDLVRCIFSHLPDVDTQQENGYISLKTEPYGVPCMVEIFQFLCSLLTAVETTGVGPGHRSNSLSYDEDVPLFSLGLINSVIELGGACLGQHPELLTLLENNLFHSLIQFGMSPSPLILSTVCSIVLNLYHLLRAKLKLQLEAFFSSVLMRIAQNKDGAKYHQQEVAMETIVDLCRQPMFIYEMYTNYDCDISCTNIFEDLVNLLSKTAFPVNTPLTAIHVLALEGLIVMTSSISEKITSNCESQELITSPDLENNPFWNLKCENYENSSFWVPYIHKTKHVKKKLSIGADHFNSDPKKGLEFVQGMRMLPDVLDPVSVACFLRYTTGLDKTLVGDYLGNHDRFHVDVLLQFAKTFDFRDMNLDTALRVFLETFRLPGESQKIQRFVEAFADQYYEQSPDIFANKDAALLLSYSLILLNTDRHSPQVKRKMSEEDFIRNNRRINGGNDLPREYLSELYGSICENEIRMTPAQGAGVMTHDNWVGLIHKSRQTVPYIVPESVEQINNEMFVILSGPNLAALSVVLDLVEQDAVLQICIDGFLKVAKIAGCYQLDDVIDGLLVALSKFTNLLTPVMSVEDAVFEFGNNSKSMSATIAVFTIANAYGDYIRSGWRNTVDCILTLHKLGLLPTRLNQIEDPEIPVSLSPPPPAVLAVSHSRKSSGLMGRFNDFLYYDTEKPAPQPSQEHLEAQNRAIETVKTSHVNNIFTESKFLQSDSLLNLLQALTGKNKDEEASVFCLELLITVTLKNRDRIMLLWENVFGYISSIVQSAVMPSKLVEKAVSGLLQICQRLLPYKENLTDDLLKSLQLILKLDARVADAYCQHITQEIMKLVKANASQIKSHVGWRTITSLLSITASHPEASDPGFETLSFIMSDGTHLLPANFVLCVNAARQFSESRVGDTARGIKSLDLMSGSVKCLVKWSEEGEAADKVYQDIGEMWMWLLQSIRNVCLDPREEIRNHSILTLQYCLTLDGIHIQDELWAQCFESVIFTLVTELLEIAQDKSLKEYRNMEGTVILSVKVLVKVFLHSLASVSRLDSFRKVWVGVLSCFERFMKVKIRGKISDKVSEIVVEVLKESLVVMKLVVGSDDSFWELTWLHVKNIAPDLQSEIFP